MRHRLSDRLYERKIGLNTCGNYDMEKDISLGQDTVGYEPTYYFRLKMIFERVKLTPDDVLIDIGCGKGRVLLYAAHFGLRKLIGIEMSDKLAEIAKDNVKRNDMESVIKIIQADAAKVDLSKGTVFYMNNPFGAVTMKMVFDNIGRSLTANPRRIRIVYLYPSQEAVLDSMDWLESEEITGSLKGKLRIWHSRDTV
ncbi:MAG: methyltransferase domain-containing protein [Armatimonadota bacterium]